ncbi:hypothetical protein AAG570_012281 [Ranatra chinensis]|uniref:Uncharacterized protein n=1 Tax=Ranatra chinensis TaxID=642074 RepID=A0ABD0YKF3_9HEMI
MEEGASGRRPCVRGAECLLGIVCEEVGDLVFPEPPQLNLITTSTPTYIRKTTTGCSSEDEASIGFETSAYERNVTAHSTQVLRTASAPPGIDLTKTDTTGKISLRNPRQHKSRTGTQRGAHEQNARNALRFHTWKKDVEDDDIHAKVLINAEEKFDDIEAGNIGDKVLSTVYLLTYNRDIRNAIWFVEEARSRQQSEKHKRGWGDVGPELPSYIKERDRKLQPRQAHPYQFNYRPRWDRFCVGDRFYLCENKILCEYDYEERLVFANMAYNPPTIAQLKRHLPHEDAFLELGELQDRKSPSVSIVSQIPATRTVPMTYQTPYISMITVEMV